MQLSLAANLEAFPRSSLEVHIFSNENQSELHKTQLRNTHLEDIHSKFN
jgi:hypothetical protein